MSIETTPKETTNSNLVQWNLKVPEDKKNEIIKTAVGKYSMNVSEFVLMRCLEPVEQVTAKKEDALVSEVDLVELDALRELVKKQQSQILQLTEEKQELLDNLKAVQLVPVPLVVDANAENKNGIFLEPSTEIKETFKAINDYRRNNDLEDLEGIDTVYSLVAWSNNLYNKFSFKDTTGMNHSEFEDILTADVRRRKEVDNEN